MYEHEWNRKLGITIITWYQLKISSFILEQNVNKNKKKLPRVQ